MPARFPATANDLGTSIARVSSHMDLGCRLTFDGHLDADLLSRAVQLSLDAEPILGCSFRTGWYSSHWQRLQDLDRCVPFSIAQTKDPDAEAVRFQAEPIDDAGPQAEVRLLRSSDHEDLCLKISHVAADGQAAKQYAYLLGDLYTRLAANGSYAPLPNLTPRPAGTDVWNNLTPEQRRAARKARGPVMPNWDIPHRALSGRGRTHRDLVLGPERFSAIKEHGKSRGATVNDVLLTAFFRSLARSFDPPSGVSMSFTSTADHRRYLPVVDRMPITNLSLSVFLGMEHVAGESFDDTLARTVACMSAWKETCYGVVGQKQAASFSKLGCTAMRLLMAQVDRIGARGGKSLPLFTNMGVLDEQELVFAGLAPVSARMLGPAAFGGSMVPTVSTYRDTLTVSIGFCEADIDLTSIERILRSMDEEL